jgi:riboflavin synthase
MFTGLIESVCPVRAATMAGSGGMDLSVDLGPLAQGTQVGDSIAVHGVCLTVTRTAGAVAYFDVGPETLRRSTLGSIRPSAKVNVERAMQVGDRFGGHMVQGHVDGVARIETLQHQGAFLEIAFGAEAELLDAIVIKGSVAVDGVSLTVAGLEKSGFSVAIIPQTASATTLGLARVGDKVNIETDLVVKAVRRTLERIMPARSKLTADRLKALGF